MINELRQSECGEKGLAMSIGRMGLVAGVWRGWLETEFQIEMQDGRDGLRQNRERRTRFGQVNRLRSECTMMTRLAVFE